MSTASLITVCSTAWLASPRSQRTSSNFLQKCSVEEKIKNEKICESLAAARGTVGETPGGPPHAGAIWLRRQLIRQTRPSGDTIRSASVRQPAANWRGLPQVHRYRSVTADFDRNRDIVQLAYFVGVPDGI